MLIDCATYFSYKPYASTATKIVPLQTMEPCYALDAFGGHLLYEDSVERLIRRYIANVLDKEQSSISSEIFSRLWMRDFNDLWCNEVETIYFSYIEI